jgi:hypothetical protein
MSAPRKKRRSARPRGIASVSSIYAGNKKIGEVLERAGKLRATGAAGDRLGTFSTIHQAISAIATAARTRAAGCGS